MLVLLICFSASGEHQGLWFSGDEGLYSAFTVLVLLICFSASGEHQGLWFSGDEGLFCVYCVCFNSPVFLLQENTKDSGSLEMRDSILCLLCLF